MSDKPEDVDNPVSQEVAVADDAPTSEITVAAAPTTVIPQDTWDHAVAAWINDHVRSSPIAQGAAGAWEHLHAALPRLKELLEREIRA